MKKDLTYGEYLWKTIKWLLGNLGFGLFPLIFMGILYVLSNHKIGGHEMDEQIYEGAVIFVFLAIIGAVGWDYYLSGIRYNGITRFMTNITPAAILFFVALNYLLIKLKIIEKDRFSLTSITSIVVFIASIVYIIFVKTNLYIKEDERNANRI
jgi:hypothetical protein